MDRKSGIKEISKQEEKLFRTKCINRQKQYGNYVCIPEENNRRFL